MGAIRTGEVDRAERLDEPAIVEVGNLAAVRREVRLLAARISRWGDWPLTPIDQMSSLWTNRTVFPFGAHTGLKPGIVVVTTWTSPPARLLVTI